MSEYVVDFPSNEINDLVMHERIVRCKDCYFAYEIEGGYWCDRFVCGREHVTPNGFCAWAERRQT